MGPSTETLNSLLQVIPARALGLDANSPVGQQASMMLVQMLKNYIVEPLTGISAGDPLWNAPLYSNMTNFGIAMQNLNTAANIQGFNNMVQMQASARYQFYEGLNRTAVSREAFDRMSEEERGGWNSYESFIEHRTQGMMGNKLLTMLMMNGIWDPTGKMMASFNMKEASANIARTARWRGEKDWADKADAVGQMFLNDKYELDYSKRDYGGMSLNETTALVAALTKGMDFGAGGSPEAIQEAVKKLQKRTQDMTKALAPLKDIFGDDIPNMIRFMEEISGRDIRQLDSAAVTRLARKTMNDIMVGNYTERQIHDMSGRLQGAIAQMDVPYQISVGAASFASDILKATNAGFAPSMMTRAEYESGVADRTVRQAASKFANNANLAYSVWKSTRGKDEDSSIEEFERQYQSLRASGNFTAESALLELSGASSVYDMARRGYAYTGYNEGTVAGLGARLAGAESLDRKMRTFKRGLTAEQRAGVDELMAWMRNPQGELWEDKYREILAREDSNGTKQALTILESNKRFEAAKLDFFKSAGQKTAEIKSQNAEMARQRAEFREQLFGAAEDHPENAGAFLVRLLTGNENQGFDLEEIKAKYSNLPEMKDWMERAGLTKEDLANIDVISKATMSLEDEDKLSETDKVKKNINVIKKYMEDIDTDPRRKAYLQRFIDAYKETGSEEAAQILKTANGMTTEALGEFFSKDKKEETLSDIVRTGMADFAKSKEKNVALHKRIKESIGEDGKIDWTKLSDMKSGEVMLAVWSDYKSHIKDADYKEQFQEHLKTYLEKDPAKGSPDEFINNAIRAKRINQLLAAEGNSKEAQDIKHAKNLIGDLVGSETDADKLVRSYGKKVLIEGMSVEEWRKSAASEVAGEKGGKNLEKNWEKIQEQLDIVGGAVSGAPDVVQQEKKSLEDIMSEFVNPDGVLGQLKGAVNNLVSFLEGQGAGNMHENASLKDKGEVK